MPLAYRMGIAWRYIDNLPPYDLKVKIAPGSAKGASSQDHIKLHK